MNDEIDEESDNSIPPQNVSKKQERSVFCQNIADIVMNRIGTEYFVHTMKE